MLTQYQNFNFRLWVDVIDPQSFGRGWSGVCAGIRESLPVFRCVCISETISETSLLSPQMDSLSSRAGDGASSMTPSWNLGIPFGISLSRGYHCSILVPCLKCRSSMWLNRSSQASSPLPLRVIISWQKPHQNPHCPFLPILFFLVSRRVYSSSVIEWSSLR